MNYIHRTISKSINYTNFKTLHENYVESFSLDNLGNYLKHIAFRLRNKKIKINKNTKNKIEEFVKYLNSSQVNRNFLLKISEVRKSESNLIEKFKNNDKYLIIFFEMYNNKMESVFERSYGLKCRNYSQFLKLLQKSVLKFILSVRMDVDNFLSKGSECLVSGKYSLLILSGQSGVLAHEILGHLLENEKIGFFSNKKGEKIAPDFINVVDNPKIKNAFGSFKYSADFKNSKILTLVRNGVIVNYLSNNPNLRRENFFIRATPRLSNTYITSDKKSQPLDALKSSANIIVNKVGPSVICHQSGNIKIEILESYSIKSGFRLLPFIVYGNAVDVLRGIKGIAGKAELISSNCKSKSGVVPVSYGGPNILVENLLCINKKMNFKE